MTSRRHFLTATGYAAAGLALAPLAACSGQNGAPAAPEAANGTGPAPAPVDAAAAAATLISRAIPSTGELLPVIGAGTSGSFEVPPGTPEYEDLKQVLRTFFEGGGTVFDTSPNYGNADEVLGELLAEGGWREQCFLATKVAEDSREALEAQWAESQRRLRSDSVDLLFVHNMRAFDLAWPYVQELKAQGRTRYIGFTHYLESGHEEMERRMREVRPDFIQINYSVNAPQAARSLLPAAQELGVAVLINRAFDDGKLFARVRDMELPGWAAELGITSWAQMFLKFAISHPAVTAVIPATGKPERQADQLKAGTGELLDQAQQDELVALLA